MIIDALMKILSSLPKPLKRRLRYLVRFPAHWFKLHQNYAYDRRRFARHSSVNSVLGRKVHLQSWISGDYHKIEKALALRSPRPGFGTAVVSRLVENLDRYFNAYGFDENCVTALNVLKEYVNFNKRNGFDLLELNKKIEEFFSRQGCAVYDSEQGGAIQVSRVDILRQGCLDLEEFFDSRHSIRQFSDEPVPRDMVSKAVEMARRSPSVCNRQSWKVYAYSAPESLKQVVACQKGNSGFGDQIKTMLVVTSNTETFFSIGERNQCWVDGGMFAMSLVYALHSLGLGTICLNWSVEKAIDVELHRVAAIPESEAVIMMIGVGFLPEFFRVAQSHRKPVEEILVWAG